MIKEDIIRYYDLLMRIAVSKCSSQSDAEDLVSETMLAALACIHNGGRIEHLKAWLINTLYHKHNDNLRKKYRSPITVCLDDGLGLIYEDDNDYFSSEEASNLRKEINQLAYITREVLIRYYFGGQSVLDISSALNIPEGTVKSRLFIGRNQIKKGLNTMETKDNHLPGELHLSFGGSSGLKGEPITLVENDLIAKNLLILAYEKPFTISELSKAIGIPAAYIEPVIKKLVDGELMVKTDGGKLYSDFIITKPQDALKSFKAQLGFAHKNFETVWKILNQMSERIGELVFITKMNASEQKIIERYAILKALQDFCFGTGKKLLPDFPKRRDGGFWLAEAMAIEAGYDLRDYNKAQEYAIWGGHRSTRAVAIGRTKVIDFYEFDTTLWDCPHRYGGAYEMYFKYIIPLLWCIHDNMPLEAFSIPNEFISYIPTLETVGLIGYSGGKPFVKIPIVNRTEYQELYELIKEAVYELKAAIGAEFSAFEMSLKTPVPKHLTYVPELYRFTNATKYFPMAIVREAYDRGMHLKDVDYCCPPVVMVYEV